MKEYHLEQEVGFKCDQWPAKGVPNIRPFPEECWEIMRTLDLKPLTGEYHYRVRAEQRNGQRAWTSPVWVSPIRPEER